MRRVPGAALAFCEVVACFVVFSVTIAHGAHDQHEDNEGFAEVSEHDDAEHLCDEPPPPMNGDLICGKHRKNENRYVCRGGCDAGYQFPNGKKKWRHVCDLKTGKWTPEYIFPDCQPICNPPCSNGGECAEGNHCICTPDYRGDRCQYAVDLCDPERGLHVSADWICNHTLDVSACIMNCPQGTRYESPPADVYRCSIDGAWTPSFAPKCIPINVIEPPAAHGIFPIHKGQMVSSDLPNSGVCAMWATSHVRTFDGGIYSFQGPCIYQLSKDCEQNTFTIQVRNSQPCDATSSCPTVIVIFIGSEKYILENGDDGPVVQRDGTRHGIPTSIDGLMFQELTDYVSVSSSLGFRLKWNRKNTILLKVTSQLRNKTCGLCGKFDGSSLNDFETSDGSITDSVEGFVNSWTMDELGENCPQKVVIKDSCSENKDRVQDAERLCGVIFDDKFSSCHQLVDPKVYFEVCKMDHCSCTSESCYCGSLAEYFRECTRVGGKVDGGWRNSQLCPLNCPEGMVYKDCGTSCPKTCKRTVYDCEDDQCVDGCHCPDGTVLHSGRCVERTSCSCMHNGKEYLPGSRVLQDCNACECNAGKWECTKEKCEARCSSAGDPHYTTFDGLDYEFYGHCPYYLVYSDNFTIVQESGPCESEPATDGMFCTNSLQINYLGESLLLQPGIKITYNEKNSELPVSGNGIAAAMATDLFLKASLANGVSLLWDGQNRIYIDAPPTLFGQTMGLCGTFNKNQNDDFMTPGRDIEAEVSAFAARWKASDACHKRSRRGSRRSPCVSHPQKLKDAELLCSTLNHDLFAECHGELDPSPYYKSCVTDLCSCNRDLEGCFCPIIADYSLSCSKRGVIVNWIEELAVCKPECSGGQEYNECGNPCTTTCSAISSSEMCIAQCVQGCTCAEGMALNAEGFCVAISQCPCEYEGKEYLPASITVQKSNICTCEDAKWQCRPGSLSELVALNPDVMIDDGSSQKCNAENNEEFTQCRDECPRTCQNIQLPQVCKTEECKPGCKCKEGYVFDTEKQKCVEIRECGCTHGRRRYTEGETIKQSCNLCTCAAGAWKCTEKICPGACSSWGESHFKTFDGKIFDFHGDCEYILSKGKLKGSSYSLTVQNVPCGSSGITCSKSFTLDLGPVKTRGDISEIAAEAEKLTLTKGDSLPKTTLNSRFVVLESGLFVLVYTDIGVSLQWDRGTRIYVRIDPKWKERVKGLCGNFNGDQSDDFLTPSGGIPEARVSIFAESWKVHEFCPQAQTITDACEMHPQRKSWAEQKCGILKSETFTPCHSEVSMEPFYERCIFDSCACDMGGDCDCLCTAIAAYAQECSIHGVPIKWRSQELCPIQCEECATYDSCISSCPKETCENELVYDRIADACANDFCIEGCNPKPCPEDQLYNNGREYKCIPKSECVVPCLEFNGRLYNEGDRVTDLQVVDACQSCHCLRGAVTCTGPPCADIEPARACVETGWTPWMNTPAFVGGDFEILTDPRMKAIYENYCGIANMTDIECREVESKQPYQEVGQKASCRLPKGFSCRDGDQKDSVCKDYEIRVYCDCGPIPTTTESTTPPPTTPVKLPSVCEETGWTPWMSGHWPSADGEYETLDRLRSNHYFCANEEIENIECRTTKSWRHVSGEEGNVVCNKKVGLVCKGSSCEDYEVRLFCKCGEETTVAPVPACVTGWTEFFNVDNPETSDTGDDESLDRIRELHNFCFEGTIEDIECKTMVNGNLVDYKDLDTFGLKCSKNVGFVCNKHVRAEKCEDFMVRFYCACEEIPVTTTPVPTTTKPVTTPVPLSPVPVECGWTPWLNIDSPENEIGDIEDLSKIQMLYKTCGGKDLVDIECRMARTHHDYSVSLQKDLVCDTENGFRCLHKDQIGKCYDYEIRLLCMYEWCFPKTTTPVPTTTFNPCPPGEVYDECAYHCDQMCSYFAHKFECSNRQDGCIAGCRPVSGCQAPNFWRDKTVCVSREECTCYMEDEDGRDRIIAPNDIVDIKCGKCQCVDNNLLCHDIIGCGEERTAKPRILIQENILQEDCWTKWVNTHNPSAGGGDFEITNKLRRQFKFCDSTVKIECRTAESHQRPHDVGQMVTCDVNEGLVCWNKENKPEGCYDYEIRFFCPCPNQIPTTTTPVPTLEPGECIHGWTDWYNNHRPDARGEYESVQSSRIYHSFCSNDMITAIECRQVGKGVSQLQRGVICDLEIGLKCNPEYLDNEEECSDYEVRFFCECPGALTTLTPENWPPLTTGPPLKLSCAYWSEWINENHPSSAGTKSKGVKGGDGNRGDSEKVMLLKLQREYDFCNEGYISDIECREAGSDLDYTETGDSKLVCNVVSGFRCRGRDQPDRICKDYKIRYFCACNEVPTTTVTTKPTTPEVYVKPCDTFYRVIDGPSPLPDTSLKASTSKDSSSGPQAARMSSTYGHKSAGSWVAGKLNEFQFIEVDLGDIQPVYGVVTKGQSGHESWVKSYKVLYSRDGIAFTYVKDNQVPKEEKVFSSNFDSETEVQHIFSIPFEARFVRIQPITFHKQIAMRMDILGCADGLNIIQVTTTSAPPCADEMGMYTGFIRDYQILTSSDRSPTSDGRYIRLNTPQTEEHSGGWVAGVLDDNQFVQVDFLEPRTLTGVKIQGRDMVPHWVTSFFVSYSNDGVKWNKISENHEIKVFPGNYDKDTAAIVYFPQPVRTRFIRIHPVTWENWISMRLEILGCFESFEEVKDEIATTPAHVIIYEECTDPMGFENNQLPDAFITVSSSRGPNTGVSRIRLNTRSDGESTGGWIAAVSDYMPRVLIDFTDVRNLTAILTQGLEDDDLWVMSYKVRYSLDNVTWNFAYDMETGDIVFAGNFDRNSVVLRLFSKMIQTQFLEIIILDYHTAPALRMEIWGCFLPYTLKPTPFIPTTTEVCVENGPWLSFSDPAASPFGDEEPIDKIISASGVCSNPFDLQCRTVVTGKDYTKVGQIVSCDLDRGLVCRNDKQASFQCYNYEVRIKCWTCNAETTVTTPGPIEICPEVPVLLKENCKEPCPHGYSCDGMGCVPSLDCPCYKEGKMFNASNVMITSDCQKCDCFLAGHSVCEEIQCPSCLPGQKSEMDTKCHCSCTGCADGTLMCPTSGECVPEEKWCDGVTDCPDDEVGCPTTTTTTLAPTTLAPTTTEIPTVCATDSTAETSTCEMVANMFETFDGLAYQYDICDHVLMKESSAGLYSVSVHKTCPSEGRACDRYLVIEVDGVVIKLGPSTHDITVQENRVPVSNLWLVSKRFQDFELMKRGSTLVFRSKKYNFDVVLNGLEDVKIVVSKCLIHNIVGLCGLYNKRMEDDLTMPNGNLASRSEEFGDSWSIGSLERCTESKCPEEHLKAAIEICSALKDEPFHPHCSDYVKVNSRIEACIVYMCECMQRSLDARHRPSNDVFYDLFNVGACKCQAYESFVEACEESRQSPLPDWRMKHDCTPECPPGMEWQDCGPGCELTCDNYRQSEELCSAQCVPGCYCPSGLVRHHNKCVKPKMCQDCVCRGHGDPNYITFDGRYYAFQGICSYILAQHKGPDESMNFRVVASNIECPEEPGTSCTHGVTVYWRNHVVEKFKDKPVYLDGKALNPEESPLFYEGISITFIPGKSTVIHIKEINLVLRYFDQMYGYNIELPAFFYFNKTEGLCGVCNFIQSDDLYHRDGYVTDDVDDFAYSWLEESGRRSNCELPREEVPEPPPFICNFTTSPCEIFLDPTLYSESCQNDVSYSRKPEASMCRSKFQYAQQCCERGVSLVDWLQLSGCENTCPDDMIYECTSACPKTCENYKDYDVDNCDLMPLYTCVCPEGKVLKLGRCIDVVKCETCDPEGHVIGDAWQVGPCEKCECLEDLSVHCITTECPEPPICNVKERLQKLNRSADACCDVYQCMAFEEKVCPEYPLEDCLPGQAYVKDYVDGCPVHRCECIPEMCPPAVVPLLDEGENFTLVTVDCCTQFHVYCNPDMCEPPPQCSVGFKLSLFQSKCCEKYTCIPKKNVCVYQHKYGVVDGSKIDLPLEDYYDKEYEPGSSWQDGLCRKCSCVDIDGQFAYSCRQEMCPDPSDFPDAEKYEREVIHPPGSCCPKYRRVACLVNGVKYSIGEEWPSPDGDPCKTYKCVADQKGEAERLEKTTICDRSCPKFAEYIEPAPGKCCGMCKAVACEEDGVLYEDGAKWISASKPCFTAQCIVRGNGTVIKYQSESCPIMPDNCPPENLVTDPKGCCTYCKAPTETCSAVEIPSYETRGFFGFVDTSRGFCSNNEVLHGLTKCGGQCTSQSMYSDLQGDFQSVCNCCLPQTFKNRTISLTCEDGTAVKKLYMQPITCQCLTCSGGGGRTLESMNQVEPYKK